MISSFHSRQARILVYCPDDLPATIFHLRSLALIARHYDHVDLIDRHHLAELIVSLYPNVTCMADDEPHQTVYDVTYALADVCALPQSLETPSPYLAPSAEKLSAFSKLTAAYGGIKVGIVASRLDCVALLSSLPRHRLHQICFFTVTEAPLPSEQLAALKVNCIIANAAVHNYVDAAALAANMDCIITDNEVMAHIAGALDRTVLYAPGVVSSNQSIDLAAGYRDVTVFHDLHEIPESDLLRRITFALLMKLILRPLDASSSDEKQVDCEIRNSFCGRSGDIQPSNLLPLLDCATPVFQNVSIETTTICNLSCPYCPNSSIGRPPAYMPDATFYRIIDSVADFQPDYCGNISPHFYGEPLLDTRLEAFVRYARNSLPQALIQIFTNGELLTVERFLALVNAGVQKFVISQHSPLPAPHLMETLRIIHSEYADHAKVEYFDQYHSNMKMNRGGLLKGEKQNRPQLFRCNQYKELVFDVSGTAVLCCNDYLSTTTFGTIHESSVRDIWQNIAYTRIRNLLFYSYFPLPVCQKCSFL